MIGASNIRDYKGYDKLPPKVMDSIKTYTLEGWIEKRKPYLWKRWRGYYEPRGGMSDFQDMCECIYDGD